MHVDKASGADDLGVAAEGCARGADIERIAAGRGVETPGLRWWKARYKRVRHRQVAEHHVGVNIGILAEIRGARRNPEYGITRCQDAGCSGTWEPCDWSDSAMHVAGVIE